MKERPILFKAEMVQAILDGRKSQTRRIVKFSEPYTSHRAWEFVYKHPGGGFLFTDAECTSSQIERMVSGRIGKACPNGMPGDRLWVRETFHINKPKHGGATGFVSYRADGEKTWKWKPSIFMPRWASRITLEIESVHIERLQSITKEDAMAEGWQFNVNEDPIAWYRELWDKINVKPGTRWEDSPWVWVIEFRNISARR